MHAPSTLRGAVLAAALLAATVPSQAGMRARGLLDGWSGVPPVSGIVRERHVRPAFGRHTGWSGVRFGRRHLVRSRRFGFGRRFAGHGAAGGYRYGGVAGYRYGVFYGGQGSYGSTATQLVYGPGPNGAYLSERPLAVRFVEPPLAPSPYAPYSPTDRYAGTGAAFVVPAPRPVRFRYAPPPCTCGGPFGSLLPYGIGTAY